MNIVLTTNPQLMFFNFSSRKKNSDETYKETLEWLNTLNVFNSDESANYFFDTYIELKNNNYKDVNEISDKIEMYKDELCQLYEGISYYNCGDVSECDKLEKYIDELKSKRYEVYNNNKFKTDELLSILSSQQNETFCNLCNTITKNTSGYKKYSNFETKN